MRVCEIAVSFSTDREWILPAFSLQLLCGNVVCLPKPPNSFQPLTEERGTGHFAQLKWFQPAAGNLKNKFRQVRILHVSICRNTWSTEFKLVFQSFSSPRSMLWILMLSVLIVHTTLLQTTTV
uniref:Uncharacterized protein n=1 Tax=Anguilla anguilla TaxID=7936 RepID=A0A0E9X653_ANGAN